MEHVILVDNQDHEVGSMEKIEAHKKGMLHRAFSILLFNDKGEILLQKRASHKYHSAGLWTNICCSHPMPGEKMEDATKRKLLQEMGIETPLKYAFKFIYKADVGHDLIEHECDHVFIGKFSGQPTLNPLEAEAWRTISLDDLKKEITRNPHLFTHWFLLIMNHPGLQMFVAEIRR